MGKKDFFKWIVDRHLIYLKKEKYRHPKPWTTDPIFLDYKFCNPFRENDKTTRWFRENFREKNRDNPEVFMGTAIFRWFNYIPTGKTLLRNNLLIDWNTEKAKKVLGKKEKIITGAYVIRSPDGMSKLDGICWCIDNLKKKEYEAYNYIHDSFSLQKSTEYLAKFPFLGNFMAYEIVTDLRHTHLLEDAKDIMTWANVGPGARRGLNRVYGRPIDYKQKDEKFVREMQELLDSSSCYPPLQHLSDCPALEMRDIEHSLCEFDKYERIRLGEGRLKNKYNGRATDKTDKTEVVY